LLNGHPQLVVPPECGFALWLKPTWSTAQWSDPEVRKAFAAAVQGCRKFETWSIATERLVEALDAAIPTTYPEAVSRIYEAYATMRGKAILAWGDKNNYYIEHIAALQQLYPQAKFVHIVRDVRDVACSYLELAAKDVHSKYRPELSIDPAAIAEEWRKNNQGVLDVLEGSASYLRLRYEDLVSDVPGTLAPVLDLIGVTEQHAVSGSMHLDAPDEPAEFLQWKEKLTGPVDAGSVGRYRKDLSKEAVGTIESICRPLLSSFGYEMRS
jgi:hypothetical protein